MENIKEEPVEGAVAQTDSADTPAATDAPQEEDTAVEDAPEPEGEPETADEPEADSEPEEETKALSFNQIAYEVERVVAHKLEEHTFSNQPEDRRFNRWPSAVWTYDGYAIVKIALQYYRADYTLTEGSIEMVEASDWPEVEKGFSETKRVENTVITFGEEVKAMGQGVIGGYLVKFTDADQPDLEGDWFDAETDFGPHRKSTVYYGHGLDEVLGLKRLGDRFGLAEIKIDNVGVWLQHQLDIADEYERAIYGLVSQKKLGFSSGTASHLVRRTLTGKSYHIDSWPLGVDASLTPQPAAGPGHTTVIPLKSFVQEKAHELPSLKALLQEAKTSNADATAATDAAPVKDSILTNEEINMTPEELKQAMNEAVQTAVAPLQEEVSNLKDTLAAEPATNDPGHDTPEDDGQKSFDVMYNLRYGGKTDDESKALILNEVAGGNYKGFVWNQNQAFAKYLRGGTEMMEVDEKKLLKQQVFAPTYIMKALKEGGLDMHTLKDTMVEAQGSLGGFAVPPNMQESIAVRLPGLTAVRGNGARVITLIRGNSTEVPKYAGGDSRYRGNIRGQWGSETQAPAEQNATLEMDTVTADIYTYKIPMSTSLTEDAMNLIDLVENDIVVTAAIDEDEVFLVGDGVGKPLGWLPGGLNSNGLASSTIAGGAFTAASIKALRRKLATQYRNRAAFVGNSDSYGDIEALTVSGTGSDYAFPDLSETGQLLRRPALESEAMPDVATNAFPLLFADMSGYYIVERAGLTVMRMQDSGTGINKVELHVRKRVGGRPVEIWKGAVQQILS